MNDDANLLMALSSLWPTDPLRSAELRSAAVSTLANSFQRDDLDHWAIATVLGALVRELSMTSGDETKARDVLAIVHALSSLSESRRDRDRALCRRVDLSGLAVTDADLSGLNFSGFNLNESAFRGVVFERARLTDSLLVRADWTVACLSKADFSGANLNDATMLLSEAVEANFERARFWGSCVGTNLSGANFRRADLTFLQAEGATFAGACFEQACLARAALEEAVGLTQSQLASALGDASTRIPPGLERPSFWPKKVDVTTWQQWIDTGTVTESRATIEYE